MANSGIIVHNGRAAGPQDARQAAAGEPRLGLNHAGDKRATRSAGDVLNRMVCEDCGTVFYSAAAKTLVEQGQACAKCGGRLTVKDGPGPVRDGAPLRGAGAGNGDDD
jgi:DNA-directed RNA polymerase subunit RPC12/RpoP